jgi:hypothetical protein
MERFLMNIGICFSRQDDFVCLSEFLEKYFKGNCLIDNIFGIDELKDYNNSLDILFLDKGIKIEELDYEEIKNNIGEKCCIINCYNKNKIEEVNKMLDEISFSTINKYLFFILPDSKRFIKLDDIIHITQVGRMVVLLLKQGMKFKYAEDIKSLSSRIVSENFSYVSPDCIVNFDYIKKIDKYKLVFKNGFIIPIDSNFLKEFENKYYKYKYINVCSKKNLNTV